MKLRILLILFATFSLSTTAQNRRSSGNQRANFNVSGKVIEEGTNLPLEFATIAFVNPQGKIVTGGITNTQGVYSIDVPAGLYTIRFEFIYFETRELSEQRIDKKTVLPNISLALDSESLDEVVIRAETTEVQVRLDKKIYNIGKDLTTAGATVSDALNNVPSVTVDVDGAIALRGNGNVQILINGKPSAIAGFGDADALRQLPAEAIEKVEVITSPSARYDAEGTAGIINLILRKEKTLGLNGQVRANVGIPWQSGLNGNVNIRTEKFNIFNNTGLRYRETPGNAIFDNRYFDRVTIDPETGEEIVVSPQFDRTLEVREIDRSGKRFNTNLGMEYYLNDKSSITGSVFYRIGDDKDVTTNITDDFSPIDTRVSSRERVELETEDDSNLQFAVNYSNNINDSGHKLTADLQWETGKETQEALITERTIFPEVSGLPSERITQKEDENEYLAQADYVLPIGENAQFEAGYRGRFQETVTDYLLTEQLQPGEAFVRNDSLTNVFTFTQNIHAAYTQYGNKFGDFSFLLGLRLETTEQKGEVTGQNVDTNELLNLDFDNDFVGLFPTVNLIYELAETENISLGYNRRINRPRGFFLNPFPSRASEANVFQGNPELVPAYASAFDLGYLKRWDKITLTSSVYYQYETGAFERIQEDTGLETPNGIPIIRTIPINLSTNQRYGFEAAILYNPKKWLRLNGSFNFYGFQTEGEFNGVDYGNKDTSWFARGSAKVTLPAKIDWQTTFFYRGPRTNAQSEFKAIASINLAFSKDIFDDKATIGLNISDLLNSRKRRTFTTTPTFTSDSEFQWRQRQVNFSFTYRFNQKKQRQRGRGDGGFEDDGEFEGS